MQRLKSVVPAALALGLAMLALAQEEGRGKTETGLAQGIMAGEVTATSAILQSRLTSTATNVNEKWSGIPGQSGVAQFEYAASPGFEGSQRTPWLEAQPGYDFIVKTKVNGLKPATRYHYRLHYGRDKSGTAVSPAATFRTLAGREGAEAYSFAVVTGMNYSFFHYQGGPIYPAYSGPDKHLGFPGLASILKLKPDFFVGTGDNVYYDHPGLGRAETLHQMRMKHHEQYSQQRFIDLFREVATYWEKDDHDHRFNDSDPVNPHLVGGGTSQETYAKTNRWSTYSGSGSQPSHELGLYVFREQMPVVDPQEKNPVTYRTHRVSRDLQIWFVEGRDYRSPNDMPDGPKKTIWGERQKAWLKKTLLESDAAFKIMISPTPMVGPDSGNKRDSHVNLRGFRHEGDEFFRWLTANGFDKKNFYLVCGDRHWQYHGVHPSGIEEFSTGALVAANTFAGVKPGTKGSTDPKGLIKHLHFNETPTAGFLIFTVKPGPPPTAVFDFYDKYGKHLYGATKQAAAR